MRHLNRRSLFAAFAVVSAGALSACVQPPQTVLVPVSNAAVAAGCDSRFQVVNRSSVTVREFYFSHASLRSFGVDQLGQNVLQPGQGMNFVANNPGNYDFRAVFMNGARRDLYGVDICRASVITVTNGGLVAQ